MQYDTWYAWIPTNLGILDFKYIGKIDNLSDICTDYDKTSINFWVEELQTKTISDTYTPVTKNNVTDWMFRKILPSLKGEIYSNASISISKNKNKNNGSMNGIIRLFYPEVCEVRAKVDIKPNGICKIYEVQLANSLDGNFWEEDFETMDEFFDYLAQVIFIIIKYIVHSDNHHHQKIDTAIKVERAKAFSPLPIIDSLIRHVKSIESDVKKIDHCRGRIKIANSIEEAKGYRSYINTFYTLFLIKDGVFNKEDYSNAKTYIKEPKILDNIIASLEAHVSKSNNKPGYWYGIFSILLVYVAAMISGAILSNNLMQEHIYFVSILPSIEDIEINNTAMNWNIYWFSVIFFGIFIYWNLRCQFLSIVYYKWYHLYEFLFHLEALKEVPKKRHKIIKFVWLKRHAFAMALVPILMCLVNGCYNRFFG